MFDFRVHIACLNNPEWLECSRQRIASAVAAGVDAIFNANSFHGCKCRHWQEKLRVHQVALRPRCPCRESRRLPSQETREAAQASRPLVVAAEASNLSATVPASGLFAVVEATQRELGRLGVGVRSRRGRDCGRSSFARRMRASMNKASVVLGPPRRAEWLSWAYAVLWTGVIYVTIPVVRTLREWVAAHFGRDFFIYSAVAVMLAVGLRVLLSTVRQGGLLTWRNYGWLAASAVAYGYYLYSLRAIPEEAIHLLEYGGLGFLLFRALSHRMADWTIYLAAAGLGAIAGTVDEIIQYYTPRRFFQFRDIWMNLEAVLLMQATIWLGLAPRYIAGPPQPASIRITCRAWLGAVALAGLCGLNTPRAIDWYSQFLPGRSFLQHVDDTMAEYGCYHVVPGVGSFYSRFGAQDLAAADAQQGAEVAKALDRYKTRESYAECLKIYTAGRHPFAHEARVHLFRRDVHVERWKQKTAEGNPQARWDAAVAWSENAILERYFSNTLRQSSYLLPPDTVKQLREQMPANYVYDCPVSNNLITAFRPWHIASATAATLIAIWGAGRWLLWRARRLQPEQPTTA
jgi:VanZ family protein